MGFPSINSAAVVRALDDVAWLLPRVTCSVRSFGGRSGGLQRLFCGLGSLRGQQLHRGLVRAASHARECVPRVRACMMRAHCVWMQAL